MLCLLKDEIRERGFAGRVFVLVVGGKLNEHDCGHIDSNQSQKIINDCANRNGSIMEKGNCPGESWKLPVDEIMCVYPTTNQANNAICFFGDHD